MMGMLRGRSGISHPTPEVDFALPRISEVYIQHIMYNIILKSSGSEGIHVHVHVALPNN